MCRSPLCSLVKMFPYIHSLSSSGVSDAVAENEAQETLAFGEWELNQHKLEKASRANGAVPLAGSSVAALVLDAADGFEEPQLLQPVLDHQLQPPWHVTRGCASCCTEFITLKGDRLAREDALSGASVLFCLLSLLPATLSLSKSVYPYPKVTCGWSCQASSTAEEILESLWAEVDGS